MTDFYNLSDVLSQEERLFSETLRNFVDEEILPIIEEHFLNGTFPELLPAKIADLGVFGITIPEEYGGAGASYKMYGLAMQELERGDSAVRSFASVQSSLVMFPLFKYASEELKKKWLPKLASAEAIGCFGLTEPDYGSNPAGMITTATETENGYLLNGAKMWITNGTIADIAVVWAKLNGQIHGFLVEKGTPGFSAPEMKGKHSLRASVTSELVFQDCEIPKENILNISGLKGPLSCLTQARYGIAWGAVGAAIAVYESAVEYAKSRIQFGKPIASFQLVQEKLAWMLTEITKAQLINLRLADLMDSGKATPQHVSFAKRNNVDIALQCARISRDIHGANGILAEYPVMRHAANLESVRTYEGTHDIHTLILGQHITGIAAYE
ncbi:MAG: acyl-CoA dehydrogenase family protein [Candidatus Kapabacteria bacterium]|nr:acyl-CoA dehydrogenase family protein [Ignavibacteriota bacterium]MCW5884148.1 acyl-CoA dehydrogenase family protein [Candidatus Kapabacteria bacterium]